MFVVLGPPSPSKAQVPQTNLQPATVDSRKGLLILDKAQPLEPQLHDTTVGPWLSMFILKFVYKMKHGALHVSKEPTD